MVHENQVITLEDLNVSGMMRLATKKRQWGAGAGQSLQDVLSV
jgi:hypothetical protein